jgi:phage shock protein PspC (stress-responsive transcriptional regulator)
MGQPESMTESTRSIARRTLVRPQTGRMIGGVCVGAADYLRVDVTLVRIALVLFTLLGGAGLAAYVAAWLVIPEDGADRSVLSGLLHR